MKLSSKYSLIRISVAVVILIIAILIVYFSIIPLWQHQQQIKNINLQNNCTNRAIKIFDTIQGAVSTINYTYTIHYSTQLKRCYILIHGIGINGIGTSDRLIDVYNNQDIADCESYGTASKLNSCIYNGSKELKYNLDRFNNFIKPYMEAK